LIVAVTYWLSDSSIHYLIYDETGFEVIPSSFNELWMRAAIFILIISFGIYVDISVKRMNKLYDDRYQIQLKLDQAMTKLLSGYLSICCVCKKVNKKTINPDKDVVWEDIDYFISKHTDMEFTHGYCPECGIKAKEQIGVIMNNRSAR